MMLTTRTNENDSNITKSDEVNKIVGEEIKENKHKKSGQELKNLSIAFNEKSNYESAYEYLNLAIRQVEHENLTIGEKSSFLAECYFELAKCQRELGFLDEAINFSLQARNYLRKSGAPLDQVRDLKYVIERNLGIVYLLSNDYLQAADCFRSAMNIAQTTLQSNRMAVAKSYYGLSLVLSEEYVPQGFKELNEARLLFPQEGRESSKDWVVHRYQMGKAYESVVDYSNALVEYGESIRVTKQAIDPQKNRRVYHSQMADSHAGFGRVCVELNCLTDARNNLLQAIEHYNQLGQGKKCREQADLLLKISKGSTLPQNQIKSTQTSSNLFGSKSQENAPKSQTPKPSLYRPPALRRNVNQD